MNRLRRNIIRLAGVAPIMMMKPAAASTGLAPQRLVLDDFEGEDARRAAGVSWSGFTDRVMGGRSLSEVGLEVVDGKRSARMTGTVTRRNNGGFIQLAMYFERGRGALDASAYKGISLLVRGNDENYNLHVQTSDSRWYDSSYRFTFFAPTQWTRIDIPWTSFEANNVPDSMNTAAITRIGLLGWMREFEADIALGEISLFS